jgi:TIR domain
MPGKDVFLSYASEDRLKVAIPLMRALEARNVTVWFDRGELRLGDSLRQKISDGLRESRFVVVIVSPASVRKQWPKDEWTAALALEESGPRRVLPVLYDLSRQEAANAFPLLADRLSEDASDGFFQRVAERLAQTVNPGQVQTEASALIDFSHQAPPRDVWDYLSDFADTNTGLHTLRTSWLEEPQVLKQASVVLMPPPLHSHLTVPEIDELERWVDAGGGLFLFGHYDLRHHSSNAEELAWRFDFEFGYDVVLPADQIESDSREWVSSRDMRYAVRATLPQGHPLSEGVSELALIAAASVRSTTREPIEIRIDGPNDAIVKRPLGHIKRDGSRPVIDRWIPHHAGPVTLVAARKWGKGRVVVAGTWKLCTVDLADNRRFLNNAIGWLRQKSSI